MSHLICLDRAAIAFEMTRPDPAKVTLGDPVHTTWNFEDRGSLSCGLWHSTTGAWRVSYTEWEFVNIREGVSVLHEDGGQPVTLRAGDSYVIRPGFQGIWEVVEATLKDYVISA